MVRADIVTSKLSDLTARISRVRAHTPATSALLRADVDALDLVSI